MIKYNILVIGDCHFKSRYIHVRRSEIMVNQILEKVEKLKDELDFIVVLGDTLHTHETVNIEAYTRAVNFLMRLSELVKVYLLIGNHDLKNNKEFCSKIHAFNSVKPWKNVTVVDEPLKDEFFTFCPYVATGRFKEALEKVDYLNSKIVFGHQEIRGVKMGNVRSIKGDVWPQDNPLLVTGHIHDFSTFDNVINVGTPMQQNFGETKDKAIMLIKIEDDDIKTERIYLDIPKLNHYFINADELDNLDVNLLDYNDKITISGTSNELILIKKSKIIKEIEKTEAFLNYKTLNSKTENLQSEEIKPFKEILYSKMDTNLKKEYFNNLFADLIK